MTGRLEGGTIVITAGSEGIGGVTVLTAAREGARVIATDVDATKLAACAGRDDIVSERLNVLDPAVIEAFDERYD